ncbi:unnamed protein product [Schistosoma intercalatum]|nr:unnamed protein product [Schistosoma intercalatum]
MNYGIINSTGIQKGEQCEKEHDNNDDNVYNIHSLTLNNVLHHNSIISVGKNMKSEESVVIMLLKEIN